MQWSAPFASFCPAHKSLLTANDTKSAALLARRLADEQQVGTAGLEVVKRLEAVDAGSGLGQGQELESRHGPLVFRVIRDQLQKSAKYFRVLVRWRDLPA